MPIHSTMTAPAQLAKHLRELFFGDNWTCSDLKTHLAGVTWQQATTQVYNFNTIAALVYHMSYYVSGISKVLQGGPLETKDTLSFSHPPITSEADWQDFLNTIWADAERFAALVEQLPETKLWEEFVSPDYGIYFRNLLGVIEHTHYHLGQVVLVKKLVQVSRES